MERKISMDELLRAREVCAGYGQENVLRKVSFSVQAGELCALLGSNGSGKSASVCVRPDSFPGQYDAGG